MTANAGYVTLPAAWRPDDEESAAGPFDEERLVRYDDLAEGLRALAGAGGAGLDVILAAAHVKVLAMLTEDGAFRTDAVWTSRDPRVRVLRAESPGGTWRELVDRTGRAIRSAAVAGDRPPRPGQVLFVADASSWRGWPDADRYGLRVCVRDGELTLHAARHAVARDGLDRLAAMYRRVLEAMASGPGSDAAVACLPDAERHAVLARWGTGARVERGADTVVDLFGAQVARTPDAAAVRGPGTWLTYSELDRRSSQIARHLVRLGARLEKPVGVCLRRTADLLPALLAVWKSGAPFLPLDADLPAGRLRRMVSGTGCDLVVTSSEHQPALGDLGGARIVRLDEEQPAIAALPGTPVHARLGPANLAYIIYTSGSTGDPKGVMVHHGGLANYLLWTAAEYAARGTGGSPFFTSIGFDLGVPSLFTPLLTGQAVDLLPDPFELADLGELLAAGAPYSFVKMTPGHLNLLSLDLTTEEARDLAGLVIAAGDAFPAELARRWIKLAGPGGTPVATEYGPTEITVGNSGRPITDPGTGGLLPLGAPIPNTTMYVLTERLEPVPVGLPAEVYVGGAGVARGYVGAPALTAERFVPDPYGPPGARLYRTGDRARWRAPGDLEFLGRTDHQVKIRGYRVEVGEVRQALRRHPDVDEAVVIACGRPSRLAAFVTPAAGRDLDAPRVRASLAAELPEYMIPSDVVAIGTIPLTANGKVDTRALRDSFKTAIDAAGHPSIEEGRDLVSAGRTYQVVVNREEQYSIWDAHREPPDGWRASGFEGTKDACLVHIAGAWTDMRPASIRTQAS
jgi:amino acid adenylation domain-containing protein